MKNIRTNILRILIIVGTFLLGGIISTAIMLFWPSHGEFKGGAVKPRSADYNEARTR